MSCSLYHNVTTATLDVDKNMMAEKLLVLNKHGATQVGTFIHALKNCRSVRLLKPPSNLL